MNDSTWYAQMQERATQESEAKSEEARASLKRMIERENKRKADINDLLEKVSAYSTKKADADLQAKKKLEEKKSRDKVLEADRLKNGMTPSNSPELYASYMSLVDGVNSKKSSNRTAAILGVNIND